jgi:hypothetical protein
MAPKLTWTAAAPITIGGDTITTLAAPAVIAHHDYLYVLAPITGKTPAINQLTYDKTNGWSGNTQVTFSNGATAPQTLVTPALAVLNGVLYMAWVNQPNSDDNSNCSIGLASLSSSTTASSWVSLSNSNAAPLAYGQPISMVVFPWKGKQSLWIFYNNGGSVCVAIAQPSGSSVSWPVQQTINMWTTSMDPKTQGGPAAAILNWLDPNTLTSYSAPYVVYRGETEDSLYYVYYNANTNTWVGNKTISVAKGPSSTIDTPSTPALFSLPRVGNIPPPAILLFQGNTSETTLDAAIYDENAWYGNVSIGLISLKVGSPHIDPTTTGGVGGAFYGPSIAMVFPSMNSKSQINLYAAWATVG